jgi:hypothetical protein
MQQLGSRLMAFREIRRRGACTEISYTANFTQQPISSEAATCPAGQEISLI